MQHRLDLPIESRSGFMLEIRMAYLAKRSSILDALPERPTNQSAIEITAYPTFDSPYRIASLTIPSEPVNPGG